MSIGVFMLVKNEAFWIGPWLKHLLPYVDEFVLFDGFSDDGTLEIIEYVKEKYDSAQKIRLFYGKDPANLKGDYTRMFDEAMRSLRTDLAFFCHPDMYVCNPEKINDIKNCDGIALFTHLRSFAGNPGDVWYEIKGRAERWKNIYRLRNPDLGAHYHGDYGAQDEDVYFKYITGDSYDFHGEKFERYPYAVDDSGLRILHFSDVRHYERRLGRMKTCLENQGYPKERIDELAKTHPRVTLKDGDGFEFIPAQGKDFDDYLKLRKEFDQFLKVHANS